MCYVYVPALTHSFLFQIVNNKQIMYDCDKGYVLDVGPPGATCVGGKWRPLELPQCLLGQHPRLRWNRKRRSIEMRYISSTYRMREKRDLEKKLRYEIYQYFPQWKNATNNGKMPSPSEMRKSF